MPYIKYDRRTMLDMSHGSPIQAKHPGELNYQLTTIVQEYFVQNNANYQAINDIIGALEACKLEFYRRVVVPYETEKIAQNGDVYDT